MTTEKSLIDSALRGWKSNVERADKLFGGLSPGQLEPPSVGTQRPGCAFKSSLLKLPRRAPSLSLPIPDARPGQHKN
jgi:hypothetical protein